MMKRKFRWFSMKVYFVSIFWRNGMKMNRKLHVLFLSLLMVFIPFFNESYGAELPSGSDIQQVNAHVGKEAATSRNITWVTETQGTYTLTVKGAGSTTVFTKSYDGVSNGQVYFYQAEVTGLKANTQYNYVIEGASKKVEGSFHTSRAKNEDGKIRFAYIADPQVRREEDAKSAGSNFHYIEEATKNDPMDFLYIAGDHTNSDDDEDQWKLLFHSPGRFANAGQDLMLHNTIVSTQGNHDNSSLTGHINMPDLGEGEFLEGVYASDFGKLKVITLNNASYDTEDLDNNQNYHKMVQFLKEQVADAKANNMWTMVCFHKPLYTGASHVGDGDVIAYRKSLNPILTDLDVDMVLAGHDHVYTTSFVNDKGEGVADLNEEATKENGVTTYNKNPNAIFHMVAEHGGGLKWYKAVDYTVSEGDPIVPNYEFAHKNSSQEDPTSSQSRMQTYVTVDIEGNKAHFKAYRSKYSDDPKSQVEPYLYDEFIIQKKIPQVEVHFVLGEGKEDKGAFEENATTSLLVDEGSSALELEKQAPKVNAKEGYRFTGWTPKLEGTVDAATTYTAQFEKIPENTEPVSPQLTTPEESGIPAFVPPYIDLVPLPSSSDEKNGENTDPITDITDHWAESVIRSVVAKGYMGVEGSKFRPNDDATRLTVVKALAKMEGVNPKDYEGATQFTDVARDNKDLGYINWAVQNNIILGYEDQTFRGERFITREEMAAILNRYYENLNKEVKLQETPTYVDENQIGNWAKDEVKKAGEKGLLKGRKDGTFDPKAYITRGEIARILVNIQA